MRPSPREPIEPRASQLLGAVATAVSDRITTAMTQATGLSEAGVTTLLWIGRAPGVRLSALPEALGTTPQAVGHLVARLVGRGLVLREEDPADARAGKLRLSELGARIATLAIRARTHSTRALVDRLPKVLRPRLVRIAELLMEAVMPTSGPAYDICRLCDWTLCRSDLRHSCPVVLAIASRDGTRRSVHPSLPPVYEHRKRIDGAEPPVELWLEPGAIAFKLDSQRRLEVVCRSPVPGRLELERLPEGHVALYAWRLGTFTVLEKGRALYVQEQILTLTRADGETPRQQVEAIYGGFARRRELTPREWL